MDEQDLSGGERRTPKPTKGMTLLVLKLGDEPFDLHYVHHEDGAKLSTQDKMLCHQLFLEHSQQVIAEYKSQIKLLSTDNNSGIDL